MTFPNDADGDALRRIAQNSDMSKPMEIDFTVDVATEIGGKELARIAAQRGYATALEFDDISQRWTCYCARRMVPTYDGVVAAQRELDELGAPLGARCDGWGTSGN